jgi:hypothetical protein
MADPRVIIGRIVSVEGTTPGPATFISYTIAVHDSNVEGIFRLEGQRPIQRWPDTLDTVALPVGMLVMGAIEANVVRWHFMEMPAFKDCAAANPNGLTARRLEDSGIGPRLIPIVPPVAGGGTIGGDQSAPVSGPDSAGATD